MSNFAVERSRLAQAHQSVPVARRYGAVIAKMRRQLASTAGSAQAVGDAGASLWQQAVEDVQQGFPDDRALYWGRLAGHQCLAELGLARHGALFERASRGLADPPTDSPTLLLTGFDPFHLDRDISQSNPSGTVALALHGTTIGDFSGGTASRPPCTPLGASDGNVPLTVQTAVLPVRFADFDAGIVESLLAEHREGGNLRMVVTVSMGRDAFDLERFPGRRRSSPNPDNERRLGGGTAERPVIPEGLEGPEFLEFSLPAETMSAARGRWPVRDNRRVVSLRGAFSAASLDDIAEETAVQGSGGGYLSNEIAYRVLLCGQRLCLDIPIGHIHVPALRGHDADWERDVVHQMQFVLRRSISDAPL